MYKNGFGLSTTIKIKTSRYGILRVFNKKELNKDLSLIRSGDIVFFHRQSYDDNNPKENNKYPGHCGIYLSDNLFIHSSSVKGKVVISSFLKIDYWKKVLVGSKDIISDDKVLNNRL